MRNMYEGSDARTPDLEMSPRKVARRNGVAAAGSCLYCWDDFGIAPHAKGLAPTLVPCSHHGSGPTNCLWDRADKIAGGRTGPRPCVICSREGPNGRRPSHLAELVQQDEVPHTGGR